MNRLALVVPAALLLAACPGPDPQNPPRLWLALDGSEVRVKLTDVEPVPF